MLLRRFNFILHVVFALALAVSFVLAGSFVATSPIAFQMASSITVADPPEPEWGAAAPSLDVARFIGSIPYASTEPLYEVRPETLYELTMIRGQGNCANKARGMCFFLQRAGIPFQRVDLIPADGFIHGRGHTLVRANCEYRGRVGSALVDVLEGALPEISGQPIDLPGLRKAMPFEISIRPINRRADGQSDYYGTLLQESVISVTPMEDTERYFRFIDAVYVPVGSDRFWRIFYDGLAVLAGAYPRRCVSEADYQRLFASRMYIAHAATALQISGRTAFLLLPVVLVAQGYRVVRRRRWLVGKGESERPGSSARVGAGSQTDAQGTAGRTGSSGTPSTTMP